MQEILQLPDGTNIYTTDGRLHREDGPAIEFSNGTSYYFIDGVLHRDNGPAISCADPAGCHWFKHGVAITSQGRSHSLITELRQKHLGIGTGGSSGSDGGRPGSYAPPKPKK